MSNSLYFKDEHDLFRQSLRSFVQKEISPYIHVWETEEKIPRSVWEMMGNMGYLGLNYSTEYGGLDADFFYTVVFLEEIAKANSGGFAAAISVHQYVSLAHISKIGSSFLKAKYLAPAIQGKKIGALAISEPDAGSNVAGILTKAKKEGDFYILNGSKTFITNGVYADFVVVAAQTEAGLSLFVVDGNTEGFGRKKLKKMGWHCSDTGELAFDNVKVPIENLIGEEGQGFYYIMESFQLERLIMAIMGVAGAESSMALALQYMNEREAFGRKLTKFQALRHRFADLATEIEAARQMTYHTSWLHVNGHFAVKECSMAKLLTSELAIKAADICLQSFGGYGYMEEYPIARIYRDARVGTIAGGTSEIMREIIAKMEIDAIQYKTIY